MNNYIDYITDTEYTESELRLKYYELNIQDLLDNQITIMKKELSINNVLENINNAINGNIENIIKDLNELWGYEIEKQPKENFEGIVMLKNDMSIENLEKLKTYLNKTLNITSIEELGIKELAYEIKGYKKGYYLEYRYTGTFNTKQNLEKYLRNDDDILKFINIRVSN